MKHPANFLGLGKDRFDDPLVYELESPREL